MSRPTRGYLQSLETTASPEVVWHALVDPAALQLWYAGEATVELRAGGRYTVSTHTLGRREATVDVFEPGRRLRLIHAPDAAWPSPGAVLVEDFLIHRRDGHTVLRLLGSGVPAGRDWDPVLQRLKAAWMVCFSRLQRRLAAGELDGAAA